MGVGVGQRRTQDFAEGRLCPAEATFYAQGRRPNRARKPDDKPNEGVWLRVTINAPFR